MTELNEVEMPNCPFSVSIEKVYPGRPLWSEPTKRFDVGSTIPLTVEWPVPENWLARTSERLARLLYKLGIRWQTRWGQWRMDSRKNEAEVIQDNEAGLELRVTPGVLTQGHRGTYAEIEGLDD